MMVKQLERDCVMTTDELVDGEPLLEKEQVKAVPLQLLNGSSLNLWFWKGEHPDHESTNHVLSVMKTHASTIATVDVGPDLWGHLNRGEVEQVLLSIGELSNLKWLQFSLNAASSSPGKGCNSLSIKMLSIILSKTKQLEFLLLKDVNLVGSKSEWIELTNVIKAHQSMLQIRLNNYSFEDCTIDLGEFTLALSCIPSLRAIEILHHNRRVKGSQLPTCALKALLNGSCSIQALRLSGLGIGDDHIVELSMALKENTTLTSLLLWQTNITEKGFEILAHSLALNSTVAVVNLHDNANLHSGACEKIFQGLCQSNNKNNSYHNIQELYIGCRIMDASCGDALLQLVQENQSIKKLEVCFTWPQDTTAHDMGQFQYNLKRTANTQSALQYLRFYSESPGAKEDDDVSKMSDEKKTSDAPHDDNFQWELVWRPSDCQDVCMEMIDKTDS